MNSQDPLTTNIPPSLARQNMAQQDPLAQLQDIHLPAEIGLWPPAWGWWLVLAIVIAFVSAAIFFIKRKKSRNAYRALAINELNSANSTYTTEQNPQYLQALSIILRRTALSGFGSQFNASLKGTDWLQWLDTQCAKTNRQFSEGVGKALLIGPYQKQPEFDRVALHKLALLWINEHRNQWQAKKIKVTLKNSEAAQDV